MARPESEATERTYPLRAAARLTGLSPALLRAWERRHGAVEPLRTPGGTRRYRATDLERLRLLKAAVDAGHRIGQVAGLDLAGLRQRAATPELSPADRLEEILAALDDLEGPEAQRLLSLQLSALGPVRFARQIAVPLVREIGDRWADDRLGIASEHLGSGVLRSLLGAALVPAAATLLGPRIVFATLSGERHELGLQMAALAAMGAGAQPIFLGAELPVEEVLGAVERSRAAALALSVVSTPDSRDARALGAIRGGLPAEVRLWVGGAGARGMDLPDGAERIEDLDELEHLVALLVADAGGAS
jgi:DNA-binding transcriptional MerR regulator